MLTGPLLTDGRTHESTTPLQTAPLPAGALRIADLGFFDLGVLAQLGRGEVFWPGRLHRITALFDATRQRWEVLDLLTRQGTDTVDLPITLGVQHRLPARLLAVRVPAEVAAQRRQLGPGAALLLHVQDRLRRAPVVGPRAPPPPASRGEQRRDLRPPGVRQPTLAGDLFLRQGGEGLLRALGVQPCAEPREEGGAHAGLRAQECADLRWAEVDLARRDLLVRRGKGGKQRVVALNASLRQILQTLARREDGYALIARFALA